jgi:hypothetical protein
MEGGDPKEKAGGRLNKKKMRVCKKQGQIGGA